MSTPGNCDMLTMENHSTNSTLTAEQPASNKTSSAEAETNNNTDEASNLILLRWNDSESYLSNQIKKLWNKMEMTDVMLECEGRFMHAHKVILSLWSPYFEQLFHATTKCRENAYPVIIFRDTLAADLELILQFMYQGQVFIGQQDAERFLKTAEFLQIAGLSEQIRSSTAAVISTPNANTRDKRPSGLHLEGSDSNKISSAPPLLTPPTPRTPTRIVKFSKNVSIKSAGLNEQAKITRRVASLEQQQHQHQHPVTTSMEKRTSSEFPKVVTPAQHSSAAPHHAVVISEASSVECTDAVSVHSFVPTFMTSAPTQATYTTVAVSDGTLQSIRTASDEEIMNQAMHYQIEPIPMHEVQEAIAAANAESSSTLTPVMLLSINHNENYPEPERDRNDNISNNNSLFGSTSALSSYSSYILPELEHQYSSQLCDQGGTITFSASYEDAMVHQQQQQSTSIHEQHLSGDEISEQPFQPLQENCNNQNSSGQFVKIEKSGIINSRNQQNQNSNVQVQYVACVKCGKQVKEQSLKTHMKRTHLADGVTCIPCPICPKKLKSKGVYYKHMFNHRQRGEVAPKVSKSQRRVVKRPKIGKPKQPKMKQTNPTSRVVVCKGTQQRKGFAADQGEKGGAAAGEEPEEPGPSSSTTVIYQSVNMESNIGGAKSDSVDITHNQYEQQQQQQQQQYQYEQL